MSATIYSGPAKVYHHNTTTLQAVGENGSVKLDVTQPTTELAAALFGRIGEQIVDQTCELTTAPFDDWSILPVLFPTYLGVSCGASAGALVIGTRPFAATVAATSGTIVWTPDGRIYNPVRTAIVDHPTMHLGVGKPLFGDVRIVGIGDLAKVPGGSGYLMASDAITESAGSDPSTTAMNTANIVRGAWTGIWGTAAGFGGEQNGIAVEAQEEWTVVPEVKYSPLTCQGRTLAYKLDSVAFMVRVRPYGPTHSQLLAAIAYARGATLGSADLVLTGPSSKTITLKNCAPKGAGFEFGGTQLGTGEIGFVNSMTFTSGVPQPLLVFSA